RAAVVLRARQERQLAAAIEAWEHRLGPLSDAIAPREAPFGLWPRIAARIDALRDRQPAEIVSIERRLRRWKAAAIAASAIAASLMLFVGYREFAQPRQDKTLVAVLQKDAQSPAFLVSVDLEKKLLTIRAVAAQPQPGKSYELW